MLRVRLICPKCFREEVWSGGDFEEVKECSCGYSDEAWNFWHTLFPTERMKRWFAEAIVYTRGAHYPNDALQLSKEEFMEYFLGRGEMWHGGTFYAWVYKKFYGEGNPNNGKTDADVSLHLYTTDTVEEAKAFLDETREFMRYLEKRRD